MTGFTYNAVDIVALCIIILEAIMGLRRKMAGELFRMACTALTLAAGWRYYQDAGAQLAAYSRLHTAPEMADAIAFTVIIGMLGMAFALLHLILGLLMQVQFNAAIDRLGGAAMGALRGALLAVLLIFAAGIWPGDTMREIFTRESCAGRITFRVAPRIIPILRAIKLDFRPEPAAAVVGNAGEAGARETGTP